MNSPVLAGLPYSYLGQAPEAWGNSLRQKIKSRGSSTGWGAVSLHENCPSPSVLQVKSEVS